MKAPETITITKTCPICRKENSITVAKYDYDRWKGGMYIQQAFPEMPTQDREILITGIDACFDDLFPEEED